MEKQNNEQEQNDEHQNRRGLGLNQPFTLEYISYCFAVFVHGLFESVPNFLRLEPLPYGDRSRYVPVMWRMKNGKRCSCADGECTDYVRAPTPNFPFYKEFFRRHIVSFMTRKQQNDPRLINQECMICYLLTIYPLLEDHFPLPMPSAMCYNNMRKKHFNKYMIKDGKIVKRKPLRIRDFIIKKRTRIQPDRKCKRK